VSKSRTDVAEQFIDISQQHDAAVLGMWVFLGTEVLFFGGMFCAYLVYRHLYATAFAEASHYMDVLLGGINTAVLLGSSLTMALAVHAAQEGKRNSTVGYMSATALLGLVFLIIKGVEYAHKFEKHVVPWLDFRYNKPDPAGAQIYFVLYFVMTGIHALHVIIGIGIVSVIATKVSRNRYTAAHYAPVEVTGLYWHFVDIVWIFLYPLLYLIHAYT
jgi:cytochrome c oxidase subunit 3